MDAGESGSGASASGVASASAAPSASAAGSAAASGSAGLSAFASSAASAFASSAASATGSGGAGTTSPGWDSAIRTSAFSPFGSSHPKSRRSAASALSRGSPAVPWNENGSACLLRLRFARASRTPVSPVAPAARSGAGRASRSGFQPSQTTPATAPGVSSVEGSTQANTVSSSALAPKLPGAPAAHAPRGRPLRCPRRRRRRSRSRRGRGSAASFDPSAFPLPPLESLPRVRVRGLRRDRRGASWPARRAVIQPSASARSWSQTGPSPARSACTAFMVPSSSALDAALTERRLRSSRDRSSG